MTSEADFWMSSIIRKLVFVVTTPRPHCVCLASIRATTIMPRAFTMCENAQQKNLTEQEDGSDSAQHQPSINQADEVASAYLTENTEWSKQVKSK